MQLAEWQKIERFIPLTYLESIKGKPLVVKLSDEWNFVTCPQTAENFVNIIDRKDFIANAFEHYKKLPSGTNEERSIKRLALLTVIKALTDILYEVSKDEYNVGFKWKNKPTKKQKKYYKFLSLHLLYNTDVMFDLWEKVLEVNSRLGKKNEVPSELQSFARPRSMDKWRGFLYRRSDFRTKAFLTFLHEDEEETIGILKQYYKRKKEEQRNNRVGQLNG